MYKLNLKKLIVIDRINIKEQLNKKLHTMQMNTKNLFIYNANF